MDGHSPGPGAHRCPRLTFRDDEERKVVIARGTDTIGESYPSTVLMPDGKTIFCVYETYELNPKLETRCEVSRLHQPLWAFEEESRWGTHLERTPADP